MIPESIPLLVSKQNENELKIFEASEIETNDSLLGNGAFASVYEVRIKPENRKAALKRLKCESRANNEKPKSMWHAQLQREAGLINKFVHPNIVELIGVCYDDKYFGILLELCEGNSFACLLRRIGKKREIPISVCTDWALQIAEGMNYLAQKNYMHRDLKTDNVLVLQKVCICFGSERMALANFCPKCKNRPMDKLQLKITDFGFTKSKMSVGNSAVGTRNYTAPEIFNQGPDVLLGEVKWTEYADVWAYGVVLWAILTRDLPHGGKDMQIVPFHCRNGQTLEIQESWPEKWKKIMGDCGKIKPNERPKFQKIVEEFQNFQKELKIDDELKIQKKSSTLRSLKLILSIFIVMTIIITILCVILGSLVLRSNKN